MFSYSLPVNPDKVIAVLLDLLSLGSILGSYVEHPMISCAASSRLSNLRPIFPLEWATLLSNNVIGVLFASLCPNNPNPVEGPTGSSGNRYQIPDPCL